MPAPRVIKAAPPPRISAADAEVLLQLASTPAKTFASARATAGDGSRGASPASTPTGASRSTTYPRARRGRCGPIGWKSAVPVAVDGWRGRTSASSRSRGSSSASG